MRITILFLLFCLSGVSPVFSQTANTADLLFSEGTDFYNNQEYSAAIEKFRAAAEAYQKVPASRDFTDFTYLWSGLAYSALYMYDKSIEYYHKALIIAEKKKHNDVILTCYYQIAVSCQFQDILDEAYTYFYKALKFAEKTGNDLYIPAILQGIGSVNFAWGNYENALSFYERGLNALEQTENKESLQNLLNNIGRVYEAYYEHETAIEYFERALNIAKEINSPNIPVILDSLGMSYFRAGDMRTALEYFEAALEEAEKSGNRIEIYRNTIHIGGVYQVLQENENALIWYQRALILVEEMNRKEDMSVCLFNIGTLYMSMENYNDAIPYLVRSIDLKEELRLTARGSLRRDYLASQLHVYEWLTTTYIRNRQYENAFNSIEAASSKYLLEQMGERDELVDFTFRGIRDYTSRMDEDTAVINFSGINMLNPVRVIASRDEISGNELIEEFPIIDYSRIPIEYLNEIARDSRGLSIAVDTKTLYNSISNIESVCRLYHRILSSGSTSESLKETLNNIGSFLYSYLFAGSEDELSGITELIIVPDGILAFIPFETLIMPDGKYLIEKYNIRYVQSLAVLQLIEERTYSPGRKEMAAFGGAVYSQDHNNTVEKSDILFGEIESDTLLALNTDDLSRSSYNELGLTKWNDLPGTLTEVIIIGNIIEGSEVFTGDVVNEKYIKRLSNEGLLSDYKILHFATHGLVVPGLPELSALVLSLTGNESSTEDGFLTMKEIADLDIEADFVNLSACETGLGKIYGGEGVVGLTQAFLIAGANSLSVSLWQVADESTMKFMTNLYRYAEENKSSFDSAVSEVKRLFISDENYSHPYFWAPFVYYGN